MQVPAKIKQKNAQLYGSNPKTKLENTAKNPKP
jgi:hypothetical protein